MNRLSIFKILFSIGLFASLGGCTKGFDTLNQDPTKATNITPAQIITGAEKSASDILYGNSVNGGLGMLYAQLYAQTQKETSSQYQLDEGSNNLIWSFYSAPLSNLSEIVRLNQVKPDPGAKNEIAIANILSVWIYQILTDTYGDVPYSQSLEGTAILTPKYDDSRAIYDSLIQRLDVQIAALDSSQPSFSTGELIYNGDAMSWKRLANSLKLRIGIRMADADAVTSKKIIEQAVASGVITNTDEEAKFPYQPTVPDQFPFNEQSGNGIPNDYQVTSTLIDYLQQTNDPRLTIYARPATKNNDYVGKPYGLGSFEGGYEGYSYPGDAVYSPTFPGYIMSYAEVAFALSEAAQRGDAVGGLAKDFYADGVKASMSFWGVSDANTNTFLEENPYDPAKWKDIIGTQKWLALYNQGLQAWFERVRLNFKNPNGQPLFIAPTLSLDPSVKLVPFRLTYPITEIANNKANYNSAIQKLGGTDEKGIKLWWQKN